MFCLQALFLPLGPIIIFFFTVNILKNLENVTNFDTHAPWTCLIQFDINNFDCLKNGELI